MLTTHTSGNNFYEKIFVLCTVQGWAREPSALKIIIKLIVFVLQKFISRTTNVTIRHFKKFMDGKLDQVRDVCFLLKSYNKNKPTPSSRSLLIQVIF